MNKKLKDNRELDALIAEHVMGEPFPQYMHSTHTNIGRIKYSILGMWFCLPDYEKGDICEFEPLRFSSNISDAMKIVGRTCKAEMTVDITRTDGIWIVDLEIPKPISGEGRGQSNDIEEAICLAALRACQQ